jgi:chromosome partitioning protein
MYIVAVACSKGGSGKSTLAINLGVAAAQRGLRILLIDCDPQGSTRKWFRLRQQAGSLHMIEQRLRDLPRAIANASKEQYDLVLVDVAGSDSVSFFTAFRAVDLVVIPFAPVRIETMEAETVQRAANAARCPHVAVLVRTTNPQSSRNRFWIEKYPRLVAPMVLRHLIAYADSYAKGQGVVETYRNSVAAHEIWALLDYLLNRLKGDDHEQKSA